jgi:hypothetical protein
VDFLYAEHSLDLVHLLYCAKEYGMLHSPSRLQPRGSFFPATAALILFTIAWGCQTMQAQAPYFRWVKKASGTADDVGNAIAVDGGGNNYVTGYYKSGSATFGATVLTNAGGAEIFVGKYDSSGNVIWAKRAGGNSNDFGNSIAIDAAGNSYVTGYFQSTNINFSGVVLTNGGSANVFVAKYDSAGTLFWARRAGGNGYDAGTGIAVDSSGNSYITGLFYSTNATFGGVTLTNSGQDNIFVAKYDGLGNVLWAKQAGGSSFDSGLAIAVDSGGNSYVTGNFFSPRADFGGGIILTNSGENDVFVAKYDPSGNVLWARQAKGASDDFAYGIAVDPAGNSYVTGNFLSSILTFRAGVTLTNGGHNDIFLAKFDPSGTVLWAKSAGGSSDDYGYGLTLDQSTNIYLTGNFYSTNANFGSLVLTNAGAHDVFAAKYDASGNVLWAKQAGGAGSESGNGVGVDAGGNSYLTGYFSPTNASFSGILITNTGANDLFLAKLDGDVPALNFLRNGNLLVLAWPTNQFGFTLESTTALTATNNWTTVTNAPVIVGSRNFVTNSFANGGFFRLRK